MSDRQKTRRWSQYHEKLSRVTASRLDRLEVVASYYLSGRPIRSIAQAVGRSRSQICRDLSLLREQWAKQFSDSIRNLVNKELARIDKIEAEAWRAWERSQQPQIERAKELTSSGEDVTTRHSKRIRLISGEQSYLGIAIKCVEMRTKLFAMIHSEGSSDDVVINAVEVVVHNRDEAMQMMEFEQFRSIAQRPKA